MGSKNLEEQIIEETKRETAQGILWIALIIILLIFVFVIVDLREVKEVVEEAGIYGPLIFIIFKISTIVFAPLSGVALYLLAGPLFGFYNGFAYVMIGDIIGSTIAFYLSRIYGRKILSFFLPQRSKRIVNYLLSYLGNWKGIVYARVIFFAFEDIVSYAAGLTKIGYLSYIISSTIAVIIPIALIVAFGLAIIEKSTLMYTVVIGVLVVLCLLLLGVILKLFRKNKSRVNLNIG